MKTTQQRHVQRIQRVIDHIHNHSADEIDSAAVAEVAQLSSYHWHRIYVAVTGESAVATLRRVRLERSATALLRDDRPVARIASDCGFDNLQAFTRLFSRTYGLPPGKFRANHVSALQESKVNLTAQPTTVNSNSSTMLSEEQNSYPDKSANSQTLKRAVDINDRAALRLVGLAHSGDYYEIGRVFEKVMAAAEIESWPRSQSFTVGVYFDDPDIVPVERCRSFAGIPVRTDFEVPDGYAVQEMPDGLHATCLHTGPYALLPESYLCLYREWLQGAAHDARDSPCYEIYLNAPYNTPPASLKTLICLPLEGKLSGDAE